MSDDTNKRSACDRCRRQKLRCTRTSVNRPCERCQKAQAVCGTSLSGSRGGSGNSSHKDALHSRNHLATLPDVRLMNVSETLFSNNDLEDGFVIPSDITMDNALSGMETDLLVTTQHDNGRKGLDDLSSHSLGSIKLWDDITASNLNHSPMAKRLGIMDTEDLSCPEFTLPMSGSDQTRQGSINPRLTSIQNARNRFILHDAQHPNRGNDRSHRQCTSPEDIKLYTAQIFELDRRLMNRADEFLAKHLLFADTTTCTVTFRDTQSSGSTATRCFLETLLSDSQVFLALLQRIRSCIIGKTQQNSSETISQSEELLDSWPRPSSSSSSSRSSFDNRRVLDFQSSLVVISCYTRIIQAFDYIFKEMLDMIREANFETTNITLPYFLPQLSIGNVRLESHLELQIKSLLHCSSDILDSIGTVLGFATSSSKIDKPLKGLFNGAQSQSLLDALLDQDDLVYERQDGTRVPRVKQTIDQIHHHLLQFPIRFTEY